MQYLSLFIKGYDRVSTQEEDLKKLFKPFGEVKNLKMNPNGFAFVSFTDRESARIAKEQLNGLLHSPGFTLEVAFFEAKEIRQLQMEEMIDKKNYEQRKHRDFIGNSTSNMNVNELVGPLNFLMSMMSLQANSGFNHYPHQQRSAQ